MNGYLDAIDSVRRFTTPRVGGAMFHSAEQRDFRDKAKGYQATPQTGAQYPVRLVKVYATGAASSEQLEPDETLYRHVTGSWGRLTRVGSPYDN